MPSFDASIGRYRDHTERPRHTSVLNGQTTIWLSREALRVSSCQSPGGVVAVPGDHARGYRLQAGDQLRCGADALPAPYVCLAQVRTTGHGHLPCVAVSHTPPVLSGPLLENLYGTPEASDEQVQQVLTIPGWTSSWRV
ncbi:MAG: hypothetical protein J2P17_06720 [Mycobacterium sp.]|nr:hypothetical protein [Mycobacterium sp.]